METYLITGGAGFIGSNFIKYLSAIEKDIRIINIDKLTYAANPRYLKELKDRENYFFINEDICNREGINSIFDNSNIDYVLNFAAESHVDRSIEDCETFIKTNVLGTQVLLQASLKHGIKKYIQISTDEVYGAVELEGSFSEDSIVRPSNPYAASKASADMLVQSFYTTYNFPVSITRCTNNFGPNQHYEKLIPKTVKHFMEGRKIHLYGDGCNIRDWIYVKDNCSAIYCVLKYGRAGEVYNIGACNEIKNIDIVEMIVYKLVRLLGGQYESEAVELTNLIEYVEDRKGHDKRYSLDASKLKNELGWSSSWSFENSLEETLKWYIENKPWLYY